MTNLGNRRRFVGINVEEKQNWPAESRCWPHLGLNYIGTIAERCGYEVVLWDEMIQGHAPLEKLIQPGDVVGLSLVTTGIHRGANVVAPQAKLLGASYVIAGNDAAMFRAPQLLRHKDIDAVFTSDSLVAVASFFKAIQKKPLEGLRIPYMATRTTGAPLLSNENSVLQANAGKMGTNELFTVPNLSLFGDDYWQTVWATYRKVYHDKYPNPASVKNALGLLAHGCGRAGAKEACYFCSIGGVADVRIPGTSYLEQTVQYYQDFGINTFFNVTDSAEEMVKLLNELEKIDAKFKGHIMYGRAQIIANRPDLLERWMRRTHGLLRINCGIDSADESILQNGVMKSSSSGNRLAENHLALSRIKEAGAHLHFSLIFGSPGETKDSCERSLAFVEEAKSTLGDQLDVAESDIWWVTHGAPCSRIFRSYDEAKLLAEKAGKTISVEAWQREFADHADTLAVPESCEKAWYHYFTHITLAEAEENNDKVTEMMKKHKGSIPGRVYNFAPKRPEV